MTRDEHLQWAKTRALEYVEHHEFQSAIASIGSDLSKHPELANHAGIQLGVMLLLSGQLQTAAEVRQFIKGFN